MAFLAQNSTEHNRFIIPRTRTRSQPITPPNPRPKPTSSTLFSSIFSSSSTNASSSSMPQKTNKMNKFTSMAFNRLGCGGCSSPESAPEVIRSAADWEGKRVRRQKRRKMKKRLQTNINGSAATSSPVVVEVVSDVFCAPGIGFTSDAAFVDCVEPMTPAARRKHRKHSASVRRFARVDHFSALDSPYAFGTSPSGSEAYNARPCYQIPPHFPRGFSENMMSRGRLVFEGNLDGYDRFKDWRLDVDNMSYEELLDLSEKIGFVGTGLREDKIFHCLRKAKLPDLESIPLLPPIDIDWKCSICQDEYEANDEVGKLDCGHFYHIHCIKPWLLQKNSCPICKAAADN